MFCSILLASQFQLEMRVSEGMPNWLFYVDLVIFQFHIATSGDGDGRSFRDLDGLLIGSTLLGGHMSAKQMGGYSDGCTLSGKGRVVGSYQK